MDGAAAHLPAHLRLRERTRAAHEAAEATAGMRALLSGAMDEAGYHELLAAKLALFRGWETERAVEIAAIAGTWPYASRIPHLETDLPVGARLRAIQGTGKAAGPVAPGEEMSRASALLQDRRAGFWGELYVIEGSALGGQVIVRFLRERFPALSHAYYALGEHAPGRWRHFQHALDQALADDASQQIAIASAQAMFARFQQTLQDPGHHV